MPVYLKPFVFNIKIEKKNLKTKVVNKLSSACHRNFENDD